MLVAPDSEKLSVGLCHIIDSIFDRSDTFRDVRFDEGHPSTRCGLMGVPLVSCAERQGWRSRGG